MNNPVIEAIRDWCIGKFQPKGGYLTSVPEEYVTETELESKNYVTKDEITSGTSGVTAEEVEGLIGASFLENMGGAKIAQDAEGNWGYKAPGADTVVPFKGEGNGGDTKAEIIEQFSDISLACSTSIQTLNHSIQLNKEYKHIFISIHATCTDGFLAKYPQISIGDNEFHIVASTDNANKKTTDNMFIAYNIEKKCYENKLDITIKTQNGSTVSFRANGFDFTIIGIY